mgnify:CR=1 FL=1|tara:strand:+ start:116597 stop:116791 length:195 start_codon:yes stop_codon:yes gene_type:complete
MFRDVGTVLVSLIGCLVICIVVILAAGLTIAWIWAPLWVAIIVTVIPFGILLVMGICAIVDKNL